MEEELKIASDSIQALKTRLSSGSDFTPQDIDDLREAFENYEIAVDHASFVTPAEYRDYILTYVVSGKIQDAK